MKTTAIEWTDSTFNPWWGCSAVSPGCEHCYAETLATRFGVKWGVHSQRRTFGEKHWREPLAWNAAAAKEGVRHRVFCASMADIFDPQGPESERLKLWDLIRSTPNLDWQLLTKRPHLIRGYLPDDWADGYPNVWLGTSVEDQRRADERIPVLLQLPAAVRFLSCEPLLGPIHLLNRGQMGRNVLWGGNGVHWVIVGGESGPRARPMHPEWALRLRDDCKDAGVPFFFKQWGGVNKKAAGRLLDGREWNEFPEVMHLT